MVFLVQFHGVELGQTARAYIATPQEIGDLLKAARGGHGETMLHENHTYKWGVAKGSTDAIPHSWRFSAERLNQILDSMYCDVRARA